MPQNNIYFHIHVGREGKADLGYIGDNTGDNISAKNANYCELTGLYWEWKNLNVITLVYAITAGILRIKNYLRITQKRKKR